MSGQTAVYKAAVFLDEVADAGGTVIDTAADGFDLSTYTKVSGLFYTGDGGSASDNVNIVVKDAGSNELASDSVPVTVTLVPDSPVVSGPISLSSVMEDSHKLITQGQLLNANKVSDEDTDLADLSVTNLQVVTEHAGTIEDAYEVVSNGAQAPADAANLTSVSGDVAKVGGNSQYTYALFKDDDVNSAAYEKFFAYQVTTDNGVTSYTNGAEVAVSSDNWAYKPAQNFNSAVGGDVTLSYKVTDGSSTPADATASITVTSVNDLSLIHI